MTDQTKYKGWTLQDRTKAGEVTGVDNAGLYNDGRPTDRALLGLGSPLKFRRFFKLGAQLQFSVLHCPVRHYPVLQCPVLQFQRPRKEYPLRVQKAHS